MNYQYQVHQLDELLILFDQNLEDQETTLI